MATVIPFIRSDRKRRAQTPAAAGPAAIIIFPGVRYEREMAGTPVKTGPAAAVPAGKGR